jgi:hypothetical protein
MRKDFGMTINVSLKIMNKDIEDTSFFWAACNKSLEGWINIGKKSNERMNKNLIETSGPFKFIRKAFQPDSSDSMQSRLFSNTKVLCCS